MSQEWRDVGMTLYHGSNVEIEAPDLMLWQKAMKKADIPER